MNRFFMPVSCRIRRKRSCAGDGWLITLTNVETRFPIQTMRWHCFTQSICPQLTSLSAQIHLDWIEKKTIWEMYKEDMDFDFPSYESYSYSKFLEMWKQLFPNVTIRLYKAVTGAPIPLSLSLFLPLSTYLPISHSLLSFVIIWQESARLVHFWLRWEEEVQTVLQGKSSKTLLRFIALLSWANDWGECPLVLFPSLKLFRSLQCVQLLWQNRSSKWSQQKNYVVHHGRDGPNPLLFTMGGKLPHIWKAIEAALTRSSPAS